MIVSRNVFASIFRNQFISTFMRIQPAPLFSFGRAKPKVNHYTPFEERDFSELKVYDDEKLMDKQYKRIRDEYQDAGVKKTHRRERIEELKKERPQIEAQAQKLVIHNPQVGITYPAPQDGMFAVVEIVGFQFKVVQDDVITLDLMEEHDIGDQIVFDNVLLVGTKDYSAIGRPFVETAKVYASVEEQTQAEKVLGLHMRRRKTSRKSWGHRQKMTVIRIERIEHILTQNELQKAVAL